MKEILNILSISKTFSLNKKQRKLESHPYRKKTVLNKLSFSVKQGEIFGLLGPNGAGKTTSMRIIVGLIKSDSGDVFVDGSNVSKHLMEIRQKIGFLSENFRLEDFFTPNYLFDFFSALRNIPKKNAQKRKDLLFDYFGIKDFAQKRIATLSNGMRQKVSLALSIVHDPSIIILDEPTNGLDIAASKMIVDFLLEMKKQGKTIVISTHILGLAEKICDRVGIIIDGKMVLCDSLSQITEKATLEDTFFSFYKEYHVHKELRITQ